MAKQKKLDNRLHQPGYFSYWKVSLIMKLKSSFDELDLEELKDEIIHEYASKEGNFTDTNYIVENTGSDHYGVDSAAGIGGLNGISFREIRKKNGKLTGLFMTDNRARLPQVSSGRFSENDPGDFEFWTKVKAPNTKSFWDILIEDYFQENELIKQSVKSFDYGAKYYAPASASFDEKEGEVKFKKSNFKPETGPMSVTPNLTFNGSDEYTLDASGLEPGKYMGIKLKDIAPDDAYKVNKIKENINVIHNPITWIEVEFENMPEGITVELETEGVGQRYENFTNLSSPLGGALISTVERNSSNIATVTLQGHEHGLKVGDTVNVSAEDSSYSNSSAVVTDVPSTKSFSYANTGSEELPKSDSGYAGTKYTESGQVDQSFYSLAGFTPFFNGNVPMNLVRTMPNPSGSKHLINFAAATFSFSEHTEFDLGITRQLIRSADNSEVYAWHDAHISSDFSQPFPTNYNPTLRILNNGTNPLSGGKVKIKKWVTALVVGSEPLFHDKEWGPLGRKMSDF